MGVSNFSENWQNLFVILSKMEFPPVTGMRSLLRSNTISGRIDAWMKPTKIFVGFSTNKWRNKLWNIKSFNPIYHNKNKTNLTQYNHFTCTLFYRELDNLPFSWLVLWVQFNFSSTTNNLASTCIGFDCSSITEKEEEWFTIVYKIAS